MYIITQNFKNEVKNRIKGKISQNIDTYVDNISSIFDNDNSFKYTSLINSTDQLQKNLILEILKSVLEEADKDFSNSSIRRNKYLINKSNVERTITTIFGDLSFKRTYYQSKFDKSYHFLLDEELGIEKYDKYDHVVKALAINKTFTTNQKKAGEIIGENISPIAYLMNKDMIKTIPRQSVNNWINSWNIPDFNYEDRSTPNTLFIMVDEKYLGCQDLKDDIMVKTFVSFESVKQVSKGRRKLVNRLVHSSYGKSAWKDYVDWLYKIYDSDKIDTIYLISDGGIWIKSGRDELKMNPNQTIKRLLCEFHFKQAINRMTTDKDFRKIIYLSFTEDKKSDFVSLVNGLKNIAPEKEEKVNKNLNYILNNYTAIKDMVNFEIGSSMESHISHCIASFFSSRPKGYSSKNINKYLKINDYVNNDINIYNMYLKTYNLKETITINSENLNFGIFERNNSNVPVLNSSSNIKEIINEINNIKTDNIII